MRSFSAVALWRDVEAQHAGLAGVGLFSPSSISMVVVLPAPLGPSRPKTSPGRTSKVTPSTARTSP